MFNVKRRFDRKSLTAFLTDSMGNPLNYITNTVSVEMTGTLEWNGRQLSAAIVDGVRYEYSYNSEGLRTRTVNRNAETNEINSIFNYFWNNGKMIGYCVTEEDGIVTAVLKNFFDNSGEQIGYELYLAENDEYLKFFFEKNLQGDIIGVYNEEGTKVLSYWYDAWGNVAPIYNDENNDVLGQSIVAVLYTPITYRGYNYDVFTGLYYLQSRYYNPVYGRFLNADTTEILEATQGTPLGANLFAYCNNNPVNMTNTSGMNPAIVAGGLKFLFEFLSVIVLLLILVYSITYATTGTIGNAESKYYSPEAFLRALNQMYETIKRYEELLRTALYTAAILAFVKGLDGCNNHDHHIIAQTSPKAQTARDYFTSKDVGGKITDPDNIIGVKNVFHYFLHTDIYYIAINALIVESYYFHGELSRRESVYSMLGVIKQTIAFFDAAVPLG